MILKRKGLGIAVGFILLSLNPLKGQHYFGFQLNSVYGFEQENLRLFSDEVELKSSFGYQLWAFYSHRFKKQGLEPKFAMGWKYLQFEREFNDQSVFGHTYKLNLVVGLDYRVYENWILGLDLITENNLDFELFRAANSDLFRYNLQTRISYKLSKKWTANLGFSKALYPRVDHFFVANPSNQINLGLTYKLWKL